MSSITASLRGTVRTPKPAGATFNVGVGVRMGFPRSDDAEMSARGGAAEYHEEGKRLLPDLPRDLEVTTVETDIYGGPGA